LKGIGKETLNDLRAMYPTIDGLLQVLKQDNELPVWNGKKVKDILRRGLKKWLK